MTVKTKGFTLIELIIVMVILGILAMIAIPKYLDLTWTAKEGATKGAVGALRSVIAMKYGESAATGTLVFPSSLSASDFAGNQLPMNKCNGKNGIAVVTTAPSGTVEDTTNGFWYIQSTGSSGAYANASAPTGNGCQDTSNF